MDLKDLLAALSDSDKKYLISAFLSLTNEPSINFEKMSGIMASASAHSTRVCWYGVRKKIKKFSDALEGGDTGAAGAGSPAGKGGGRKGGNGRGKGGKRKKGTDLVGEDDEEIVESPRKKEKKEAISQSEPTHAWTAANAPIGDGVVKAEPADAAFG